MAVPIPGYARWRKESALIRSSAGGHGTFDVGNHFISVRHIPRGPATCIRH
jgi:hypothetical protein